MVDIISLSLIFIIVLLFAILLQNINPKEFELKTYKEKINNDLLIINLLKYNTDEGKLLDTLLLDYSNNNFDNSKTKINKIFENAFEKKICYKFYVNEKFFEEKEDCINSDDIGLDLDSKLKIASDISDNGFIEFWIKN
ncbi:MAG: hypothetical protein QXM96_01650 [Candidatus Woesearchaeota archaeon]